jgi:hypothetical protein
MMIKRIKLFDQIITFSIFLFKLGMVTTNSTRNTRNNHSCYTCEEPLIGYSKFFFNNVYDRSKRINYFLLADHPGSCRYLNTSSSLAFTYAKQCNHNDSTTEYECRKLVISYRSVDTYLLRDCIPKGLCAWKDKARSVGNIPILDCVYTDERAQRLECIYCCDTPLCNRTISFRMTRLSIICLLFLLMIKKTLG